MAALNKIRARILDDRYYLSVHAEQEMREDRLQLGDIENAVLKGKIDAKFTVDYRWTCD